MIELTEAQRQALREGPEPCRLVDPQTQETYVLLRQEVYERVAPLLHERWPEPDPQIPEGIRVSQEAFWADLPELLKNPRNHGYWVAYHRRERIGIAWKTAKLRKEIQRRGIPGGEYYLGIIQPHELPPWGEEEIEGGGHEVDEDE